VRMSEAQEQRLLAAVEAASAAEDRWADAVDAKAPEVVVKAAQAEYEREVRRVFYRAAAILLPPREVAS
jgi:hypothetical protein